MLGGGWIEVSPALVNLEGSWVGKMVPSVLTIVGTKTWMLGHNREGSEREAGYGRRWGWFCGGARGQRAVILSGCYEYHISATDCGVSRINDKRIKHNVESFSDSDTLRRFEALFMSFIHCLWRPSRQKTSLMNVKMMLSGQSNNEVLIDLSIYLVACFCFV